MVELSAVAQDVIQKVETMTVLELNNLVKALEEKFGVTAAAPVAAAVVGGAAGAPAAEASSTVSVILTNAGASKIAVLKVIREVTGLGLKEAKDLVDGAPKPIKEDITPEEAKVIKEKVEKEGGKVDIK